MTIISDAQKCESPITTKGLLKVLNNKIEKDDFPVLISEIKKCGVDFSLSAESEQEIRRAGSYLSKKTIDDLLTVIRENYRSPQVREEAGQLPPVSEPDPTITGNVIFGILTSKSGPLYFALHVHIVNSGGSTLIQGYRAKFSVFKQEFTADVVQCADFQTRKKIGDKEEIGELTDLRNFDNIPFRRQYPRDAWLCFKAPPGGLPTITDFDDFYPWVKDFTIEVIDGAGAAHALTPYEHFPAVGKRQADGRFLERVDRGQTKQAGVMNEPDLNLNVRANQVYVFSHAVPPPRSRMVVVMNVHVANDSATATMVQAFALKVFYFGTQFETDRIPCAHFRVTKMIEGKPVVEELTNDLQAKVGQKLARHDPWDGWLCFEAGSVPVFRADDQNAITRIELQLDTVDGADRVHSTRIKYPFQHPWSIEKFRF